MLVAVMTLFYPDLDLLAKNILVLNGFGIPVVLYDNTEGDRASENERCLADLRAANNYKLLYVGCGVNEGLGVAFNVGVDEGVKSFGGEDFIFLDQDTDLSRSDLKILIEKYLPLKGRTDVAVFVGVPVRGDGQKYRYKLTGANFALPEYLDALLVITSFSIIPLSAIKAVGGFQSDFFIDHIDYDFCWKARKIGRSSLICPEANFTHEVGNGDVRLFGKIICPISSPFRGYYQVRNTIISSKRGGAPVAWSFFEIFKRFVVIFLNGLFGGGLIARLRYGVRGLIDGFRGVGGKYGYK